MSRKKELDVTFESWKDLIEALQSNYTLSFKDVCMMLKSSRTWVNQYVRPNVHSVYIKSNYRGDVKKGINWVQVASIQLGKPMTESIWFHKEEFFQFLNDCTYSVTKQTKSVPVAYLMTSENKEKYFFLIDKLDKEIMNEETPIKRKWELIEEKNSCHIDFLKQDTETQTLIENAKSITKRKEVKPVPIQLKYTDIPTEYWQAPHDLKEYGDADELIYRKFFAEGYIRIELHLPDTNGVLGKKIFYTHDTNYLKEKGSRIIVAERDWLEYLKVSQE